MLIKLYFFMVHFRRSRYHTHAFRCPASESALSCWSLLLAAMCVCAATYSLLSKNHWTNIYHRACLLKNLCIQFVSIHSTVLCTAIGGKHTKTKQNKRRVSTRRQAANSHSELSAVNANPQFPMNNINLLLFNTLSCFSVFLYPCFASDCTNITIHRVAHWKKIIKMFDSLRGWDGERTSAKTSLIWIPSDCEMKIRSPCLW